MIAWPVFERMDGRNVKEALWAWAVFPPLSLVCWIMEGMKEGGEEGKKHLATHGENVLHISCCTKKRAAHQFGVTPRFPVSKKIMMEKRKRAKEGMIFLFLTVPPSVYARESEKPIPKFPNVTSKHSSSLFLLFSSSSSFFQLAFQTFRSFVHRKFKL